MWPVSGQIEDVDQSRDVTNGHDIEAGQTRLFLELSQSSISTRFMGFDVSTGRTPLEQPMFDEKDMSSVR